MWTRNATNNLKVLYMYSFHNSLHFLQPHDIICFKVISYSVLLLGTWHLILIIFESTSPQQYSETWSLHVLEMISKN